MKKLLILILLSISTVLYAQTLSSQSVMELENECNSNKLNSCVALAIDMKDKFKAVEIYQKICNLGHQIACGLLARSYFKGDGVIQDKFKAIELHQNLCNKNSVFSCVELGSIYGNGDGVRQDLFKAFELYQRACNKNNSTI